MLTVYTPAYRDLRFRQAMLADEETMSYNHAWGGTVAFTEDRWEDWYDRWILHPDGQRYCRYLKNEDGQFVGEIAWHRDEETNMYMADVLICAEYRRKGYGSQALDLLCKAAEDAGITELYDRIAADNPALGLFLRHGFSEVFRTDAFILVRKEPDRP